MLNNTSSTAGGPPPSDDRQPLPEGFKIGGYRVEGVIGTGGFALTYRARQLGINRVVAIKEFIPLGVAVRETKHSVRVAGPEKSTLFDWGLQSFLNEAKTLAKFNHRNLIRIITAGRGNGTAYIIMEFVEGESYATQIQNQVIRPGQHELLKLALPLIDGLKGVHASGVIHRDIKPDNILIRKEDGSPVLLDFGSARFAVESKSRALTEIVSHGYSPFEQYQQSSAQGPWTDIYSLSAVLHHAICGQQPPPAPDRLNAMLNGDPDPLPPLTEAAKGDYTDTFLRGLDFGLNIMEKDRPQSLAEFEAVFDPESELAEKIKTVPRNYSLRRESDSGKWRKKLARNLAIGAAAAAVLAVAGYFLKPVVFPPQVLLHIQGSNTVGEVLMPELAKAYLRTLGSNDPETRVFGTDTEKRVEGPLPGTLNGGAIEIRAYGSGTSAKGLAEGKDIGMSSRKINPAEVKQLEGLGDMLSAESEHVIGLDGLSVIVHRANPLSRLSKAQVHDIFVGATARWEQLTPGIAGEIHLYARDDKSGTYDTFAALVLGKDKLHAPAKRYESSEKLSDEVAEDPAGIGFIGLPYVRRAKALAISDGNGPALLPNRLTVGLEEYPLSRRLYLYTPQNPKNPHTSELIKFALSEPGQQIVQRVNFVTLNIESEAPQYDPNLPLDYLRATYGARRLSLNFRFIGTSGKLDARSVRDLARVAHFAQDPANRDRELILIGFTAPTGNAKQEQAESRQRADWVAAALAKQNVRAPTVLSMGAVLPIAPNDTDAGREKNRRVEVWLR